MKTTFLIVVCFLFGAFVGFACGQYNCPDQAVSDDHILISKTDPIGDLQRFWNSQNSERYYCGLPDSDPGPIFREVAERWVCDQYAKPHFEEKQK